MLRTLRNRFFQFLFAFLLRSDYPMFQLHLLSNHLYLLLFFKFCIVLVFNFELLSFGFDWSKKYIIFWIWFYLFVSEEFFRSSEMRTEVSKKLIRTFLGLSFLFVNYCLLLFWINRARHFI